MDKFTTGGQLWPLKSNGAGGENPTLVQGQPTVFQFNDLPDRAPTGPLAYYLAAVLLTLQGNVVQAGGAGSAIPRDVLVQCIVDSFDWTNSWLGSVLSKQFNAGTFFPIIEFTAGGFKYGQPQQNQIPAANNTYAFSITLAIPALNDRRGRLMRETTHLAALFQPSQLKVNVAAASVISGVSTGSSLTSLTARASAVLIPRQEIVFATPMEWVLHQIPVGGTPVKITGFGRDTGLTGVENQGGVAFLGELTSIDGQGGSFVGQNVTQLQFQWRGQTLLNDVFGWVNQFIGLMPNDRPQISVGTDFGANGINDFNGYPHVGHYVGSQATTVDLNSLRFFPLVLGGDAVTLTDFQTANTDETYYKTASGESGTHFVLAQYAKRWQATKAAAFVALVKAGGANSLCNLVGLPQTATLQPRYPRDKHSLSSDQQTYLASMLAA